jgi:hypothetical protein
MKTVRSHVAMVDVFLSYATSDANRITQIQRALENEGFSVWSDVNILPGERWHSVLSEMLAGTRTVVVLWSTTSIASRWVLEEAEQAAHRSILIPALIDDIAPPLGYRGVQCARLTQFRGDRGDPEFQTLCAAIRERTGGNHRRKSAAPTTPGSAEIWISRWRTDASHEVVKILRKEFPRCIAFANEKITPAASGEAERLLNGCAVLIVFIDKSWLSQPGNGRPWLLNPRHAARITIRTALRKQVPLIPVLLPGAVMPSRDKLPADLQALHTRQLIEIRDGQMHADVQRLIAKILQCAPSAKPTDRSVDRPAECK